MNSLMIIYGFLLLLLAFSSVKMLSFFSPLTIFSFIWGLICFLYGLKINIADVEILTYVLIIVSTSSFIVGYLLFIHIRVVIIKKKYVIRNYENDVYLDSYSFIRWLMLIWIIVCIPSYFRLLKLFFTVLSPSRMKLILLYNTDGISFGKYDVFVVFPLMYIFMMISAYCLFEKVKDKMLIVTPIFIGIIHFLVTGRKGVFVNYIFFVLISYVYHNKKTKKIQKLFKDKRLFYLGISVLLFLILYMGPTIKNIYTYICGCIPMLDKVIYQYFNNQDFTYGYLSFNGFIRIVNNLFGSILGFINQDMIEKSEQLIAMFAKEVDIGVNSKVSYNAFTGYMSYFFVDFGWWGAILGSFFWGIISALLYNENIKEDSLKSFLIICFNDFFIFFSMSRFQFADNTYAAMFIFLCIILFSFKYKKYTINKKKRSKLKVI